MDTGREIAARLQKVTDKRSGLGLLFLTRGEEGARKRLLVSRFRADTGILADESDTSLTVELLEKVFMKNANSYKAVHYEGTSRDADFWDGRAIDKQISDHEFGVSGYWVKEFLKSDFRLTGPSGSRRLATALTATIKDTENALVRQEVIAATQLAPNLDGQATSISDFVDKLGLSPESVEEIRNHLPSTATYAQAFEFNREEFTRRVSYRTLQLDNDVTITAPSGEFEELVRMEQLNEGTVRLIIEGKVINDKLKAKR